ncbi:MAG TPA: ATP synthase F1 subunit delta [Chitinophagaceae bacterium]|jgi:ATP synthase, F1 delta subunit
MLNPRLASRYAKSLIDLAVEKGLTEDVYKDMQLLRDICKSNRDFVNLLKSPIVQGDLKNKILKAVLEGKVSKLSLAFSSLLIKKNREAVLPEIATAFIQQYKDLKNIYTLKLTTATPLTDSLKSSILSQIRGTTNMQNIEVETKVDEDLIGGFILQVGDQMVDASISYDLRIIARQFENNDFIYKVR